MKIAYMICALQVGGMERQFLETLKFAQAAGIECFVVTFSDKGGFFRPILDLGISIHVVERAHKLSFGQLLALLRREKPDIIHVQDTFSAFYGVIAARLLHLPVVNGAIRHAGVEKGLSYLEELLLLKLSTRVVANSQAGLDYYYLKNGHVFYNIIDSKRFLPAAKKRNCMVMTANFTAYKDHKTFLWAAKKLLEEKIIEEAILIGEGIYRKECEELARPWGLPVTFLGRRLDTEQIIAHCRYGVLSSTRKYKEGISNSILEYMASGLIAVASDIGATNEIIEHKKNGLLFTVEKPESLYDAIKFLAEHQELHAGLLAEAQKTLQEKFSAAANFPQLLKIYRDILPK